MLSALKSNLTVADDNSKSSLSSGCTASIGAEQALKRAALSWAETCVGNKTNQALPMLAAAMADVNISY